MFKYVRGLWVYLRMFWFIKIKNQLRSLNPDSLTNTSNLTLESNRRRVVSDSSLPPHPSAKTFLGLDLDVFGSKSSVYLKYLRLKYSSSEIRRKKILIIGPRNEAELFNFIEYGFSRKNIKAIDLFSYSSLIELGDMHDLKYEDNCFDIVYAGWVISYSENRELAIREMMRVCKNDGEIAFTATLSQTSNKEIISKRGYMVGSHDRLQNIMHMRDLLAPNFSRGFISLCMTYNRVRLVSFPCNY